MTPRLRIWIQPGSVITAVAVVAILAVASYAGGARVGQKISGDDPKVAAPGPAYTIAGTVRLEPADFTTDGQTCTSTRRDIHPGTQVMVVDGTGAAVTYASLGATVLTDGRCSLPFMVAIPAGRGEYGIDVAGYGQLRYPEAELQDLIELTIG